MNEIAAVGRDAIIRERVLNEAVEQLAREAAANDTKVKFDRQRVAEALREFDPLWQALSPAEQRRLMLLLVERVAYDAASASVSITFRPTGIATLAAQDGTTVPDTGAGETDLEEEAA